MAQYVMYHFAWADQREKQGYKSDVSLKAGIQLVVSWETSCILGKYTLDLNLQLMPLFI